MMSFATRIECMTKSFLISATLISVSSCGMLTPETRNNCCLHLRPIYMSKNDTFETQEQIIDYLVVYEALCGGK